MARLTRPAAAAAAVLAALLVAGCGGEGGAESAACDDGAFRGQSEELYVAIATAQNAQAGGASPAAVADLRKGVDVLAAYLDAHPPCDEALRELERSEREALARLAAAADALAAGEDAGPDLAAAVDALGTVEGRLR